jgi:2-phosphoglycerate kinase
MPGIDPDLRVILIGGSSHVGKSALGAALAARFGWSHVSTDRLARHPGRPWATPPRLVPDRVAEHYLSLSVDDLVEDVLRHYRENVWPGVEALVTAHASDPSTDRLIVEGSALWPTSVAAVDISNVAAIWVTAGDALLGERIRSASRYATRSPREKEMVDKFLARTLRYNEQMMDVVRHLGLPSVNAGQAGTVDELIHECLCALGVVENGGPAGGDTQQTRPRGHR